MKPQPPPIRIVAPCTADWNAMSGDEQRRLCVHCDKHVHNLSALSPPKLQHFLRERDGTECIAYVLRDDGTMVSPPRWPRVFGILHRVRATAGWLLALMLPSVFAGCAQRWCAPSAGMMKGTPIPGRTRVSIEQKVDFPGDGKMLLGEAPPKRPRDNDRPPNSRRYATPPDA